MATANTLSLVGDISAQRAAEDIKVFTKIHFPLRRHRKSIEARAVGARNTSIGREVMLGVDHAGKDGGGDARLRAARGLKISPPKRGTEQTLVEPPRPQYRKQIQPATEPHEIRQEQAPRFTEPFLCETLIGTAHEEASP